MHLAELEDHEQVRQSEESVFRLSFLFFLDRCQRWQNARVATDDLPHYAHVIKEKGL